VELAAARGAAILADCSYLATLIGTGRDVLDLLHRLSTNDVASLEPGRGCMTVLTSPKGRIVHRLFVHHLGDDGILLCAGPGAGASVRIHLGRFTFAEDVELQDLAGDWRRLVLIGPSASAVLERAGLPRPSPLGVASATLAGTPVRVVGQDSFTTHGYSLFFESDRFRNVVTALGEPLREVGGRVAGHEVVEAWRVLQGYGVDGAEYSEDHNPLEAGLRDAVSFDKGCYVGQEVVARLNTYDKVTRTIVGLRMRDGSSPPPSGATLLHGERKAGAVTSAVTPPGWEGPVALAYVRNEFAVPGTELCVEGAGTAVVSGLPFPD
jgi:folate-binding protein YgfZ